MNSCHLLHAIAFLYAVNLVLCYSDDALLDSKVQPLRPTGFANMEELQDYLKELRDYYAILGRPRFGRSAPSSHISSSSSSSEHSRHTPTRDSNRLQHSIHRFRRSLGNLQTLV